jgi:hypothetical protein
MTASDDFFGKTCPYDGFRLAYVAANRLIESATMTGAITEKQKIKGKKK